MVKFSKQFEGQLVPEWREAFVDYWQLKKDLKRIHLLNPENTSVNKQPKQESCFSFSSLRKFSLLGHQQREHKVIQVLNLSLPGFVCHIFHLLVQRFVTEKATPSHFLVEVQLTCKM